MKIGILTHYYNSLNYGGMLQAYALATYLHKRGYDAEQISYQFSSAPFHPPVQKALESAPLAPLPIRFIKRCYHFAKYRLVEQKREQYYAAYKKETLPSRALTFARFQNSVPHSEMVFNPQSITAGAERYDILITGSDQVWNFDWFNPAFFLDFPEAGCKKIAYAASAGKAVFNLEETAYLKRVLPLFDAISVRETDLADELNEILGADRVRKTVDPTLLLTAEDWEKAAAPRLLEHSYVFCYFLHNDAVLSKLAKRFAKRLGCKIVAVPFPAIEYNVEDIHFGDYQMDAAGPAEFLSLIRNASYVLTDSFHATVFSLLFGKEFCAFPRGDAASMGSRLATLTELFDCPERFCTVPPEERLEYLCQMQPPKMKNQERFDACKRESEEFLRAALQRN